MSKSMICLGCPAAALRTAQVERWNQKQWQSPHYWAAFTMQGEWR
ncbi:hypothetical protein BH20ACI3_BH20ACI3_32430 [soil metagenome]